MQSIKRFIEKYEWLDLTAVAQMRIAVLKIDENKIQKEDLKLFESYPKQLDRYGVCSWVFFQVMSDYLDTKELTDEEIEEGISVLVELFVETHLKLSQLGLLYVRPRGVPLDKLRAINAPMFNIVDTWCKLLMDIPIGSEDDDEIEVIIPQLGSEFKTPKSNPTSNPAYTLAKGKTPLSTISRSLTMKQGKLKDIIKYFQKFTQCFDGKNPENWESFLDVFTMGIKSCVSMKIEDIPSDLGHTCLRMCVSEIAEALVEQELRSSPTNSLVDTLNALSQYFEQAAKQRSTAKLSEMIFTKKDSVDTYAAEYTRLWGLVHGSDTINTSPMIKGLIGSLTQEWIDYLYSLKKDFPTTVKEVVEQIQTFQNMQVQKEESIQNNKMKRRNRFNKMNSIKKPKQFKKGWIPRKKFQYRNYRNNNKYQNRFQKSYNKFNQERQQRKDYRKGDTRWPYNQNTSSIEKGNHQPIENKYVKGDNKTPKKKVSFNNVKADTKNKQE